MKSNDIKNLHQMTVGELQTKLAETVHSFDQYRSEHAANKLKNTKSIYQVKKDIARIKTVLHEKILLASVESSTKQAE